MRIWQPEGVEHLSRTIPEGEHQAGAPQSPHNLHVRRNSGIADAQVGCVHMKTHQPGVMLAAVAGPRSQMQTPVTRGAQKAVEAWILTDYQAQMR